MTIRDKWILFKETVRPRILHHPAFNQALLPKKFVSSLKLKGIERIFRGNPNTITIITGDRVVRIPIDEFSVQRCRNNKEILMALQKTAIKNYTPEFLEEGNIQERSYFIESRLPGVAIDVPISRVDYLVEKAADFIAQWHRETTQEIELNEENFKNIVSCEIEALSLLLNSENQDKLRHIERKLKKQLLGRRLKTVWSHGDYKLENVLFNMNSWAITGVIDWDLSNRAGLPLLDILYLLLYKSALMERQTVNQLLLTKYLALRFDDRERGMLQKYSEMIGLAIEDMQPLLILFWLHHIAKRSRQAMMDYSSGREKWFTDNIYKVLDLILEST